ncbi:transposase [Cyanobacteria bacterium FACHB-471]|nr:transposase [Cyanobacteria bacterium FACHB-471]
MVFIDETGIHLGMTRLYGRAPIGERLYDSEAPGDGGKNISLIGGMSIDGLIATLSIVGSVNTEVFLFYIQAILIPQLWVGAILVMYCRMMPNDAIGRSPPPIDRRFRFEDAKDAYRS